jgi:uncharacterized protein (DUF58 family)
MIDRPSLLLDPQVLASIADLEMVARVTVDGSISGLHRSPFHGYSAEFSQYRHYRPGDDLKYVDWKLLARTDRIYTKQYLETTNMPAHIVLDASASMGYRPRSGVSKLDYARLLAAALSRIIGMQGDAVGLVVHDDLVRQFMPSRTGPSHLRSLMLALTRVRASGATAASSAVRRAVELMKRRGLLLILSDLYDESAEIESELRRAVRIGHEVAVFQVLTRDEVEFPFSGDVEMEDVESGRTLVTNGDAARPAYQQRMQAFLDRWHSRCAAHRIDYTRVITDMPLDRALRGYLVKRANPAP